MIKETNDRHARERNTVTREFDIIRATLASKEKEMLRELEDINKQNLAALTSFLETINGNHEDSNKLKRTIEVINKKDDVLILEEYRKITELEDSLTNVNSSTAAISGQSSHLNIEFLQQECKAVVESLGKLQINLKKEDVGTGGMGVSMGNGTAARPGGGLSPK